MIKLSKEDENELGIVQKHENNHWLVFMVSDHDNGQMNFLTGVGMVQYPSNLEIENLKKMVYSENPLVNVKDCMVIVLTNEEYEVMLDMMNE